MKMIKCVIAITGGIMLLVSGCGSNSSVDTAPLEKSFASAEPANKSTADQVVSSIKSQNYSGAVDQLKKLASQAKLTPEQQQAIKDTLAQVQKQLADAVAKIGKEGQKAATDLQKSLPKP